MSISDIDESRRQFLVYLLASGAFSLVPGCASTSAPMMQQLMPMPEPMPEGKSIFSIGGAVTVNGSAATFDTPVEPGDVVETGPDAETIFVVDKDAFLLRADSRIRVPTISQPGYGLEKGKALSVFAKRQTRIVTPSAIVSIRGTGVYLEVEPERSYVCLCYGAANLATSDLRQDEDLETEHHDAPKYILADQNARNRIQDAPFKNHSDQELLIIETLVGRTTPYTVPKGLPRTRRRYI